MTCIIDDFNGRLPLNPTKQDVAFSEKRYGEILGQNLYAWASGIVHLYYNLAKRKFRNERKGDLTVELRSFRIEADTLSAYKKLPLLSEVALTTIEGMKWYCLTEKASQETKIRARIIEDKVKTKKGKGTIFELKGNKSSGNSTKISRSTRKRSTPTAKATEASSLRKRSTPEKNVSPLQRRVRARNGGKKSTTLLIDNDGSDVEDNSDDGEFVLGTQALHMSSANDISGSVVSSNICTSPMIADKHIQDPTQIFREREELEKQKKIIAKQKHDYNVLMELKNSIQNDLERELEQLNAELRSVKAKLEEKDDDRTEEVEDTLQRMSEDRDYEAQKAKVLETKLEAEKALRQSLEREVELLRRGQNGGRRN